MPLNPIVAFLAPLKARGALFVALVLFAGSLSSCLSFKEPEFRDIRNIRVTKFTGQEIEIQAEAVLFNPNKVSFTMTELDLGVEVMGVAIDRIQHKEKVVMKANKEFTYPLTISFSSSKIFNNFFSALSYAASNRKIDVKYDGHARLRSTGIGFKVPIDYKGQIKLPGAN
jgi:LEA14-like dessication related protein